jgi:hypothetical protein
MINTGQMQKTITPFDPLGAEAGIIKVTGNRALDARIREFLDHSFHYGIRNGSFSNPDIDPQHEVLRVLHYARPRRVHKNLTLGRRIRMEVIEVAFTGS